MDDEYGLSSNELPPSEQLDQLDQLEDGSDAFANVGQGLVDEHKTAMLQYWQQAIDDIERISDDGKDAEVFKSTVLPLARIKKVMKTDSDVKMISAEAPILFAKGCDIFITELTMRAWIHAEENKRRTLQRSDIATAIQKSDVFDFLIDIVPREDAQPRRSSVHRDPPQKPINGPPQGISGLGMPGMSGIGGMNMPNVPQGMSGIPTMSGIHNGMGPVPMMQHGMQHGMQYSQSVLGLNALTNAANVGMGMPMYEHMDMQRYEMGSPMQAKPGSLGDHDEKADEKADEKDGVESNKDVADEPIDESKHI